MGDKKGERDTNREVRKGGEQIRREVKGLLGRGGGWEKEEEQRRREGNVAVKSAYHTPQIVYRNMPRHHIGPGQALLLSKQMNICTIGTH